MCAPTSANEWQLERRNKFQWAVVWRRQGSGLMQLLSAF